MARRFTEIIDCTGIFRTNISAALDEFASRIYEELDYGRECANMEKFYGLYGSKGQIIVPKLSRELSAASVITMSWINGQRLVRTNEGSAPNREMLLSELPLVEQGIKSTLSQLFETGVLHADPHAGNLLKCKTSNGSTKLAYIDFGLVADVPIAVREALVCSVIYLIERNFVALASEFDSLMLISTEELNRDFDAFVFELKRVCDEILVYPKEYHCENKDTSLSAIDGRDEGDLDSTVIPRVKFDAIISALLSIAFKFKFEIPPYFLNNARAIASLEGMALSADPNFNLLQVLYPFVVSQLLLDPSTKIRAALRGIIQHNDGKSIRWKRLHRLFKDASDLGVSRRKLISGFLSSTFVISLLVEDFGARFKKLFGKRSL